MKVVLFCGGLGTRLRDYSEVTPKPLVPVGERPVIWNLMKFYAFHGHTDFILCLGYKGLMIKEYFMGYREWASNNFRLSDGGRTVELFGRDLDQWSITFVDTGVQSNIGQRLCAVRPYLEHDEMFLANYSDGLSNIDPNRQIEHLEHAGALASFARVRPSHTFHTITCDAEGYVDELKDVRAANIWINGGFFVLRREIFDYIRPGEELVEQPFARLAADRNLVGYTHDEFFACIDTYRDKKQFDEWYDMGYRPWEVWKKPPVDLPIHDAISEKKNLR